MPGTLHPSLKTALNVDHSDFVEKTWTKITRANVDLQKKQLLTTHRVLSSASASKPGSNMKQGSSGTSKPKRKIATFAPLLDSTVDLTSPATADNSLNSHARKPMRPDGSGGGGASAEPGSSVPLLWRRNCWLQRLDSFVSTH